MLSELTRKTKARCSTRTKALIKDNKFDRYDTVLNLTYVDEKECKVEISINISGVDEYQSIYDHLLNSYKFLLKDETGLGDGITTEYNELKDGDVGTFKEFYEEMIKNGTLKSGTVDVDKKGTVLTNKINKYCKEKEYTLTAKDVLIGYLTYQGMGYVSHTCKLVINHFESELKEFFTIK